MKFTNRRRIWFFCLLISINFLFVPPAFTVDQSYRVLLVPLTVHSEEKLDFLNQGIMDMLVSRISPAATVIRKNEIMPGTTPVQMGRDAGADYVITGSLTLFGNNASTDAVLTNVKTGEATLKYNRFGQSGGDVLLHIDQFAQKVNRHLSSLASAPPVTVPAKASSAGVAPQVAPLPTPATPSAPVAASPHAAVMTTPKPVAPVAVAVPVMQPPETEKSLGSLWVSNPLKGTISALTTGDIDGNGTPDIVLIRDNHIVVERIENNRLTRVAATDGGRTSKIIAVDSGDINGNRIDEIFVTRLTPQGGVDSFVLEWNGTGLGTLADGQRWYFRVADNSGKSPFLMGQRQAMPRANDTGGLYESNHFLPGVFELTWNGKSYQAGRRLALPGDLNIYRFTRGDIFGDRKIRTLAYTDADKLRIYDPAGSPQWISSEKFGGNPLFLESASSADSRNNDRTYLSQRLVLADLDDDGRVEVITAGNRDAARGFAQRFRIYNRGRIVVLRWNKIRMNEVWTSKENSGYISDFALADMNADGRREIVYVRVNRAGLTRTKSSNIVVEQIGDLSDK